MVHSNYLWIVPWSNCRGKMCSIQCFSQCIWLWSVVATPTFFKHKRARSRPPHEMTLEKPGASCGSFPVHQKMIGSLASKLQTKKSKILIMKRIKSYIFRPVKLSCWFSGQMTGCAFFHRWFSIFCFGFAVVSAGLPHWLGHLTPEVIKNLRIFATNLASHAKNQQLRVQIRADHATSKMGTKDIPNIWFYIQTSSISFRQPTWDLQHPCMDERIDAHL